MAVLQVSAIGVWGNPLTIALRAADLVVALPPSQQGKSYDPEGAASIHGKALLLLHQAGRTLMRAPVEWASPFVSRDELQGEAPGWWGIGMLLVLTITQVNTALAYAYSRHRALIKYNLTVHACVYTAAMRCLTHLHPHLCVFPASSVSQALGPSAGQIHEGSCAGLDAAVR
jgi:hypothetical protein